MAKKRSVSTNDLILFSIFSLRGKCSFETLVKECFTLFPKSFSLLEFPKWPDSRKLDRPLRTLRKRKMIIGDPKTFFKLTNLGRKKSEEIAKTFRQGRLEL